MLANYAFIGLFFIAASTFPILPLVAARFLRPSRPTEIKLDTYECGLEALGDIWVQFKVQYYLYALAFVIFDIEVVFLYPWAVGFWSLDSPDAAAIAGGAAAGIPAEFRGLVFGEILVFIAVLAAAFAYAWKKGVFEWR